MNRKISSVIDSCNDCQFSKEYQEMNGNTSYVLVCNHVQETATDNEYEENSKLATSGMFLLFESYKKIKKEGNTIPIPDNCPLENYEEKRKVGIVTGYSG